MGSNPDYLLKSFLLYELSSVLNENFWKINEILWAVLDLSARTKILYILPFFRDVDTLLFHLLKWIRSKLTSVIPQKRKAVHRVLGSYSLVKFAWVKSSIMEHLVCADSFTKQIITECFETLHEWKPHQWNLPRTRCISSWF